MQRLSERGWLKKRGVQRTDQHGRCTPLNALCLTGLPSLTLPRHLHAVPSAPGTLSLRHQAEFEALQQARDQQRGKEFRQRNAEPCQ